MRSIILSILYSYAVGLLRDTSTQDRISDELLSMEEHALHPAVFDAAPMSFIWTNATCGDGAAPEAFCKLHGANRPEKKINSGCGVCDGRSHDPQKRHPVQYALDGNASTWWQSPSLEQGQQYHWVTVTLDLKQQYYVWYVILKCAVSARPATWILEKSLDGHKYEPWQYFATNEEECQRRYDAPAIDDKSGGKLDRDTRVICSTQYSRLKPYEGGEIHVSVAKSRPGSLPAKSAIVSKDLKEFAKARFVRFRFQRLHVPKERHWAKDSFLLKRLFYSIKRISVGVQCVCNGHASKCKKSAEGAICDCGHNTCGLNCEQCSPLFNQRPWEENRPCEKCQCHGHAESCRYDEAVDKAEASLNMDGERRGGGVCVNCTKHTTGLNCEKCEEGWYRPAGVGADADSPCMPCECHEAGATGDCKGGIDGKGGSSGCCECLKGFAGCKCDRCARGFSNFPYCRKCDCDARGTLSDDCDGKCSCKENVKGVSCDECKRGFFYLDAKNPSGCKECYCSGVSTKCDVSKNYALETIESFRGWLVSDADVSWTSTLFEEEAEDDVPTIVSSELPSTPSDGGYYWLAPRQYCDNRLASYGSILRIAVSWKNRRGDTSGKPVRLPHVILIGRNGLRIGFGGEMFAYDGELTQPILLSEEETWYYLTSEETVVEKTSFVTRKDIMSILADIKYLLIRAKFHTDQYLGRLLRCELETLVPSSNETRETSMLEKCECPTGYVGNSCERCDFGYARVQPECPNGRCNYICSLCDCNGHSATCNPASGKCDICEHNTVGSRCERCAANYYGNAEMGTPHDCKPCACPLLTNNLSPTCRSNGTGYICNQCPEGYEGDHCQLCSEGYFGNPAIEGGRCEACACDGGPCDGITGRCLECEGNAEGWKCDVCRQGYYGNPPQIPCRRCDCSVVGSVDASKCDRKSGQCECRPNFTDRTCDRCLPGLGNVTSGCLPCQCNLIGSKNDLCDVVTGECECKYGVVGELCENCAPQHFGFDSDQGCMACNCNFIGSLGEDCNVFTGQCVCRPNVIGRKCDTCASDHWGLRDEGCKVCNCDVVGSLDGSCDNETGLCHCKNGVVGRTCDQCKDNYYGFSQFGCFECEKCSSPGHICDPDTGRCICPINSEGPTCEKCLPSAWNLLPYQGCVSCLCDKHGSAGNRCDNTTGHCYCKPGYSGHKCDTCSSGYFGFPKCRPCACNHAGTEAHFCMGDICACMEDGQCHCKANVVGLKCEECRNGTFGLHAENTAGCVACFCFGRSAVCEEAGRLTWGKIKAPGRTLTIKYDVINGGEGAVSYPVDTREVCFINLVAPDDTFGKMDETRLNVTNNLRIIPGYSGAVEIGLSAPFEAPVYWQLPKQFLGDKILSYGGFLRFSTASYNERSLLPPSVLSTYPLVQIQGNRLVLEYFHPFGENAEGKSPVDGKTDDKEDEKVEVHNVRLHESLWTLKNAAGSSVSRQIFMLVLQNVQHILIRAAHSVDFERASLKDLILDTAIETSLTAVSPVIHGVEMCDCPRQYAASSCQDPGMGFRRHYVDSKNVSSTIVIQVVGDVLPCDCNNRSEKCDPDTGHCLDCAENTGGESCEVCAVGFYQHPSFLNRELRCLPCPCPSTDWNFAQGCQPKENGSGFYCSCKREYTGGLCDSCSYGYFGYPKQGGKCEACMCDTRGSVSDECHEETGQCNCRSGVFGRDCSFCEAYGHILTSEGCKSCEDGCVKILLDEIHALNSTFIPDFALKPPWKLLQHVQQNAAALEDDLDVFLQRRRALTALEESADNDLKKKGKILLGRGKMMVKNAIQVGNEAWALEVDAKFVLERAILLEEDLVKTTSWLKKYLEMGDVKNVTEAVAEGRVLLNKIGRGVGDRNYVDEAVNEKFQEVGETLHYCKRVRDGISTNVNGNLASVRRRLKLLEEREGDMDAVLRRVEDMAERTESMCVRIGKTKDGLAQMVEQVKDLVVNSEKILKDAEKYARSASTELTLAEENVISLTNNRSAIKDFRTKLAEKETALKALNPFYAESYVQPAVHHADFFAEKARMLTDLFAATRQDADVALKASKAYQNIADALRDAQLAASNASMAADYVSTAVNGPRGSLIERAKSMEEKSKQLHSVARIQVVNVNSLREEWRRVESKASEVAENVTKMGESDRALRTALGDLEMSSESNHVLDVLNRHKSRMEMSDGFYDELFTLQDNIKEQLARPLFDLQSESEIATFSPARKKIKEAEEGVKIATSQFAEAKDRSKAMEEKFAQHNETVSEKLLELRNLLERTRHLADGVHLPLTTKQNDSRGKCSRSYGTNLVQTSVKNSIHITYAISTDDRDSLLFYLGSSTSPDFLAVEMVSRKIRFAWNLGGGEGEITHTMHIQKASNLNNEEHWYSIRAERIMNVGKLSVKPVFSPAGSPLSNPWTMTNSSASGWTQLDVGPEDAVWIGGAAAYDDKRLAGLRSKEQGLVGCLHRVTLDSQPIGLWNFRSQSNACATCIRGLREAPDDGTYSFRGDGYAILQTDGSAAVYNKYLFSVSFNFKTLSEDCLLFYASSYHRDDQYAYIALNEGRVHMQIAYNNETVLDMKTTSRYNLGNWTHLELTRYYDKKNKVERGILKVSAETKEGAPRQPVSQEHIPDLSSVQYYLGGLAAGVKMIPRHIPPPFLGCLSDVQIDQQGYNPMKGEYWGIQMPCASHIPSTVVAFNGNGYLELASYPLTKTSNFAFSFATTQQDAFLMLSTTVGLSSTWDYNGEFEESSNDETEESYYSAVLRHGQIDVRINAGRGEVRLASDYAEYSDGRFHALSVVKFGKNVELRVDDKFQASASMPGGSTNVKAPGRAGGLFFGGIPADINATVNAYVGIPSALVGTIKDAVFNQQLVRFDAPIEFERASIGRSGLNSAAVIAKKEDVTVSGKVEATGAVGCSVVGNGYSVDPTAVKFGDLPFSHVRVDRSEPLLHRNFNILLKFRTFYLNGLILLIPGASGKQQPHYFLVWIRNGRIGVVAKGKRKTDITTQSVYNDGAWHSLNITRSGRTLHLKIDNGAAESEPFGKRVNAANKMYVGGLPHGGGEALTGVPEALLPRLEGLKGCVKDFTVNGVAADLVGEGADAYRVGQCFPHVERGAYFPGDAYAVYETNFYVGSSLDLELEFRTFEMNGILCSVSQPEGYPAVSLELYKGKMVLNGDTGDRRPFAVEQSLDTEYALCDNKWHRVQIQYLRDEITVKVDGKQKKYWLLDNGHLPEARTSSPLYIGGIPDNVSSGTLRGRENFKGCVRNLAIAGDRRDWTTFPSLHNVLLSSCPVATSN